MQKQSLITLFAAVWSCAAIGAAHASTHPASSSTGPIAAKKGTAAKAGHKGKRRAIARNRKGSTQADLDPDAEVLAQVLPKPISRRSSKTTSYPSRTRCQATSAPVTPPPTMATSQLISWRSEG